MRRGRPRKYSTKEERIKAGTKKRQARINAMTKEQRSKFFKKQYYARTGTKEAQRKRVAKAIELLQENGYKIIKL